MENQLFISLIYNASLLMVLVAIYSGIKFRVPFGSELPSRRRDVYTGVFIGLIGIAVMANPWQLRPGIFFDARSILLGVTGMFFGWLPTILAAAITICFRVYSDGAGTLCGISVIITSAGLGLLWQRSRPALPQKGGLLELYFFGVSVHLLQLACTLLLPWPSAFDVLRQISVPVMVIFPIGTVLLSVLLIHQRGISTIEEALRENEGKYRTLVENSNDAIFFYKLATDGTQSKFIEVNQVARELLGYSREELLGLTSEDITSTDMGAVQLGAVEELGRTGHAVFEAIFTAKDGRKIPMELSSRRFEYGGVIYVLSIARDVTERRQADTALRESEERHRALFEQARDSILLLEIPAEGEPIIRDANPAALRMHGYSRKEIFGKPISFLDAGSVPASLAIERVNGAQVDTGTVFEVRHRRKDGSVLNLEASVRKLHIGGSNFLLDISRDITERKQAETERVSLQSQLLQSQKMEAVGRLAGGVAHDFNNILTAITGYGELIYKSFAAQDPGRADAQQILDAAERAASLTRQLLTFSRCQIIAPHVVDLNKILYDITKMLCRLIGEDVSLETKLSSTPCLILADSGQIEQVVMNMVVNSRDAMPKGGTITLETEVVSPNNKFFALHPHQARGPLVRLTAHDTGHGMTAEVRSHAFEPFFTTKAVGKGTGLGLSTIFGIIKQNGGEIEFESEPGKGTTFFVYLPLASAAELEAETARPLNVPLLGRETVLLAEDDLILRRLEERVLRAEGYTVLATADGREALEALERHGKTVDLLLTDVVMAGMNGRELAAEAVRRGFAGRTLYMSGYTDDAILKHGVLEPGLAFIQKPFTVEAILTKLREVLDGPAGQAKA